MKNETESFVNQLIGQMTIEEKIGQLHQYFAWGNLEPEVIKGGSTGSVINASGALSGQGFSGSRGKLQALASSPFRRDYPGADMAQAARYATGKGAVGLDGDVPPGTGLARVCQPCPLALP